MLLKSNHLLSRVLFAFLVSSGVAYSLDGNKDQGGELHFIVGKKAQADKDYTRALEYYQKAAKRGNAEAYYKLGGMYRDGQGVKQDYAKAFEYFNKAAKKGNAGAYSDLGFMYANGQGVPQDALKAKEYWKKAGRMGDAEAYFNIGVMYFNGLGVSKDLAKAREYLEKAAKIGSGDAIEILNRIKSKGD